MSDKIQAEYCSSSVRLGSAKDVADRGITEDVREQEAKDLCGDGDQATEALELTSGAVDSPTCKTVLQVEFKAGYS